MSRVRIAIGALSVSAAAMVALWQEEGWTERAVIPVTGDVPTVGPGLTKRVDGTRVRMGDTIQPLEGAQRSLAHLQRDEVGIKACVTAPLHQAEYDLMLNFAYQYGVPKLCGSSIVRLANQQQYRASCDAYVLYRKVAGYDCATLVDGHPNKRCWGVYARSLERQQACLAAQ